MIECQIRSLENLDIKSADYGPLLIPVLLSKIPEDLNLIISRQFTENDSWDISLVLKALKTELVAREKTCFTVNLSDKSTERHMTASSLLAATKPKSNNEKGNLQCHFCSKSHKPQDCTTVTNLQSRKDILKTKKRCFVCLRTGHIAKNCQSSIKCYYCKGKHHLAVCNSKLSQPEQSSQEKETFHSN